VLQDFSPSRRRVLPIVYLVTMVPGALRSLTRSSRVVLECGSVYLISSDDGSIIRIFVHINILEERTGYVVLMGHVSVTISYPFPLSDKRNRKIYQ